MTQDIRYAVRILLKNLGFTSVVVLTLALGIGANAALFSVVNGVLLNPLPFPKPDQLITIHQSKPNFEFGAIPYPNFLDLQKQNQSFSSIAISRGAIFTLMGPGEPERVGARMISGDLFKVYGLQPKLGRTFNPEDDRLGAALVALISERLWIRKFNSANDVLERNINLDDKSYRVVGIIPSTFSLARNADVYVAIGASDLPALRNRGAAMGIHGIGRLKDGMTFDQAHADLNSVMQRLAEAFPATNKGNGASLIPLRQAVVGEVQPVLLLLLGAVGFVLLIACVNVSNLLLARSTGRMREYAIRTALGASRLRLLRQSLFESTLLSLCGGAVGLLLAGWATQLALKALPSALPRAEEVGLDRRVLLFTLALSLLTGIVSGLVPALKISHLHFNETLKEGGRDGSSTRARAQGVLVAAQMAMALILLVGAGLLIRSLNALWKVDPGFRADNAMTFGVTFAPSMRNATAGATRAALRDLSDKLKGTPGVSAVSLTYGAAPMINEDDRFFWIDGQAKPASHNDMYMALFYVVEPDYFLAMGIQLKKGRFFTNQDDEHSARVIIIDEMLARERFGNEDPLGRRINLEDDQGPHEIIGVVRHVKQWGLDSDQKYLQAQLYLPFRAAPDAEVEGTTDVGVVVRSDGSGGDIGPPFFTSIRKTIQSHNNQNVISNTQTLDEVIADSLAQRRFSMILLGSFAGVALLLASLGIYGVISYLVGQRTHELGIRLALGAKRVDILRLVLGHGMKMTLAGIAIGIPMALGLTRSMKTMLFGVEATDPLTFVAIPVLLTFVALLACYLPARRATKVDPLVALRYE